MSLSDLGSLGEFIGAIAVIASLVYLGIHIRSATKAMQAFTLLGLTNDWQDYLQFASDHSVVDLTGQGQLG